MTRNRNNYWVSPNPGGKWKAKKEGAKRAAGVFDKQREAENYARSILRNSGGGELITQDKHGKIRSKDTIKKPDPFPPRDTEY
ncbi:hypothetical protein ES707_19190 [subsurface metagenome]